MRWLHVNVVEAFLGPKASSSNIRAYLSFQRFVNNVGDTPQTGPESDVSQRKAHGYHLWIPADVRRFDIPEPNEAMSRVAIEVHANNIIRSDEIVANGVLTEDLVSQLLINEPGFIKEFDVPLTPTPELAYYNDDGGAQEVYNYRLRVRVLVTPAGANPTEQHQAQLTAPSSRFNAEQEEEGDEKNEIGMINRLTAVKGELGRSPIFRAIKLTGFAIIAIISAVSTIITLIDEVNRQKSDYWYTSNPEEGKRCVRVFDQANKLKEDGDASIVLFNYNLENASVAFCTDQSREKFDDAIGADLRWDAVADVAGGKCALDGSLRSTSVKMNCEPFPACSGYYDAAPIPFGVMWKHTIQSAEIVTVNNTAEPIAECATVVSVMPASDEWPDCDKANVYVYRHIRNKVVYILYIFAFVFVWVRLALELFGILSYHKSCIACCGGGTSEAILFRIAFRGLCGPLYYLFLMITTCSTTLPVVTDPPIVIDGLFLLCEALPNIVMPVYAIIGCTAGSNASVWMFLLLVFGIVKVVLIVLSKLVLFIMRVTAKEERVAPEEILEVKPAV